MADFTIKRNDTRPYMQATLQSGGVVYDLTGATVQFIMKLDGAGAAKVDAAAIVTDAVNGVVQYQWLATDTDTEGTYNAEFEVTDAGGKILTFPNGHDGTDYFTVEVVADLA